MLQASRPRVVAVVLTWNDTELTGRCVESVLANGYRPLQVLVADNGSSPACAPVLKERFPDIETVTLLKNRGFTGGANRGIERALELQADYVFFLNNDTTVDASAVERLVEALEERPDVGVASALLLFPGEEPTIQFYTARVYRDLGRLAYLDENRPHRGRSWPTVEIEFAPACAWMMRAEVLRNVGLFDESLGTHWEDYDFCMRLRNAGYGMITVGAAEVVHERHQTTGRASPYITYYSTRNRLICLSRYANHVRLLLNALPFARTLWWQVKQYGLGNWACHRAVTRGVFDFLVGVRGEGHPPKLRKRDRPRSS
jgi:GT2 family glycosyltransferase